MIVGLNYLQGNLLLVISLYLVICAQKQCTNLSFLLSACFLVMYFNGFETFCSYNL
jgi:hypothetical protein